MLLEDLLAQVGLGALQRDHQRIALHFAQHRLDALVVELVQVVEGEHLIEDLLRQVRVGFPDRLDASPHPGCRP
jgi:hypothetical protein